MGALLEAAFSAVQSGVKEIRRCTAQGWHQKREAGSQAAEETPEWGSLRCDACSRGGRGRETAFIAGAERPAVVSMRRAPGEP